MDAALRFVRAVPDAVAPGLDSGSVHVWRMAYARSLGRAPLIAMLAAYLGVPAATVMLEEGAKGKPLLPRGGRATPPQAGGALSFRDSGRTFQREADATLSFRTSGQAFQGEADDALSFNWSHSGTYALMALARGCAIGVDIEQFRQRPRVLDLARRFFDAGEADALARLDPGARGHAFIGLWCAKESVLKAAGEGLSFGLARLAFAPCSATGWSLLRIDPALGAVSDWQLQGFEAAPGYRGALAWRGKPRTIRAFALAGAAAAG